MISKQLLNKPLETKWCSSCQAYREHIGGTLCSGCTLTDEEVEWYIENVESQKTEEEHSPPETPQPLSGVETGDTLYLSSGTTAKVTDVTSRSVKTENYSFVKSDGTGWGSTEINAAPRYGN